MKEQNGKMIIFKTDDNKISVDVRFDEEAIWMKRQFVGISDRFVLRVIVK